MTETRATCPDWCTLRSGHEPEDVLDPGLRWHAGTRGDFVLVRKERDGVLVGPREVLYGDDGPFTPGELRTLAADALAAAEWLEVERP